MQVQDLRSLDQLVASGPFTMPQWRWLLAKRDQNGLAAAVVRINGRVFVDTIALGEWLEEQRESKGSDEAAEVVNGPRTRRSR